MADFVSILDSYKSKLENLINTCTVVNHNFWELAIQRDESPSESGPVVTLTLYIKLLFDSDIHKFLKEMMSNLEICKNQINHYLSDLFDDELNPDIKDYNFTTINALADRSNLL